MTQWSTFQEFTSNSIDWSVPVIILASGPGARLVEVVSHCKQHDGIFIFSVDTPFHSATPKNTRRFWHTLYQKAQVLGLSQAMVNHSDFGGATSASHVIYYRGIRQEAFVPAPGIPRVLKHLLNSAAAGRYKSILAPPNLQGEVIRAPLYIDGHLRQEGLFDMFHRQRLIACPSVFASTKWVERRLTGYELLRAFDIPISLDKLLLHRCTSTRCLPFKIEETITPLVVTSIFSSLWGVEGGGQGVTVLQNSEAKHQEVASQEQKSQEERHVVKEEDGLVNSQTSSQLEVAMQKVLPDSSSGGGDLQKRVKEQHDLAKAVKSDDAAVPIHLWNEKIKQGIQMNLIWTSPRFSDCKEQVFEWALKSIRSFLLRQYRRRLYLDCIKELHTKMGRNWFEMRRKGHDKLNVQLNAMRDILWRACENDWFEYPAGSRLLYWRWPKKYQKQARDGVPVYFLEEGPTEMKAQRAVSPEETAVLKRKLLKVIQKRYLIVPEERLRSLISYFGVPKGIIDDIVQDWRIVYHAGANGLNDKVWCPSFWLPGVNSLIRILDLTSVMEDRDIGEMFLNFELDPSVRKFVGVDVGPLKFSKEECASRWMVWVKNLMGFKPSPHNSIKMNLIAEEVIKGDRHDLSNAFQWTRVILNLPCTENYNPNKAWMRRVREDGTLASDYVQFVDDQRLGAAGSERMMEAGHTLSTREAYLGIQDALRKLRAAGGTLYPGAWAGAVVFNDEELGLVVLTSQEKWDRLKTICKKWLKEVQSGDGNLDHTSLRSDKGFMVHVTQAYPSMKPYLKGFHLSMETWRGGRDAEGWKLPAGASAALDEADMEDSDEWEGVSVVEGQVAETVTPPSGPVSGITQSVPRFERDLEALLELSKGDKPIPRVVRGKVLLVARYGFGDASSGGFGASVERKDGIHGRFGIWGSDNDDKSSNYREMNNLVETVEEEAAGGHLAQAELWIFTDNSTSESCFYKGSSTSPLLHELILRLKRTEIECGFSLYFVHVAGTRMIAQGTDGLSRGMLLEGVLTGQPMLSYIELARNAVERYPPLLEFIRSWTDDQNLSPLEPEEWFVEAHGIVGGSRDNHGIWIPRHAPNGRKYLWTPPPVLADVCLEECLKAVHKRRDAFHIFVIPRLFTPAWSRLFHKLCDFVACVPVDSPHWPSNMHEPLWIGISLPFISQRPWTLRRTPLLVGLAIKLRGVLSTGEGDGGDVLRELLRTPGRVRGLSQRMASGVLQMPGNREVPNGKGGGCAGQSVVQAEGA